MTPNEIEHLAQNLPEVDFELLIRAYVRHKMKRFERVDLNHIYTSAEFRWSASSEASNWTVRTGSTYSNVVDSKGEVLTLCVSELERRCDYQTTNKLSLISPPPVEKPAPVSLDDEIPF